MYRFSILAGIAVSGMLLLSSCHGKIPLDEQKASLHIIPGPQGKEYIHSFQEASIELSRQIKDSSFLDKQFQLPIAEAFNRDAIAALLNATGAQGIRIYLGRDKVGQIRLVLVPITKEGNDIYTKLINKRDAPASGATAGAATPESQVVEVGQRCPTLCDTP